MDLALDSETIAYILSFVLAVLSLVFGEKYVKYRVKATKFAIALKATIDAVEDDKITPEEAKSIIEHWKDIFDEAKLLLKK